MKSVWNAVDVNARDQRGRTAVMAAAKNGFAAVVEFLAAAPSVDLNRQDVEQKSALMWATTGRHLPAVQLLLSHECIDAGLTDRHGRTALILAAKDKSREAVAMFLQSPAGRGVVNMQDNDGWTALHFVMRNVDGELAAKLVSAKADASIRDKDYVSPMVFAARSGAFRDILCHVLRVGTGPTSRDFQKIGQATGKSIAVHYRALIAADVSLGPIALAAAARNGNMDVMTQLLKVRAGFLRGSTGLTVLQQAVKDNDVTVVANLIAAKAQVSPWMDEGDSLLAMAAQSGDTQVLKHILVGAQHEAVASASEHRLAALAEVFVV